ncbi:MAG: hypothetical protein FWC26_02090 [Fibromonadales bacterium]|nr:hypothetical protein [Fibromonadales bacterium]
MSKLYIAVFALLALVSCSDNLFGNGGSTGKDCGNDIQCLRMQAENDFRSGQYESAYNAYSKIVEINPRASVGYFGMAKVSFWWKNEHPFDIFKYINFGDSEVPFVDYPINVQNEIYQAMKFIAEPLSNLERRDSLTALYELHQINDPSQAKRLAEFRRVFCNGNPNGTCNDTTSGKKEPFPLSDREYKSNSYYGGFSVSSMAKALLNFFDINKDGCITRKGVHGVDNPGDTTEHKKWEAWGCSKNKKGIFEHDFTINFVKDSLGNFTIDMEQLMDELDEQLEDYYLQQLEDPDATPPPQIADINSKIDDFSENMGEVINILGNLGIDRGANTGDSIAEIPADTTDWQEELNKYKDIASFYKMGSRTDEDGDGCIDEELLDTFDNDGDGLNNENSKISTTDIFSPIWGKDGINNTMLGNPLLDRDNNTAMDMPLIKYTPSIWIRNVPNIDLANCAPETCTQILANEEGYLVVMAFTEQPNYWTTTNLDLKLQIAQDISCPPKYDLEYRKQNIGGCWLFYDNNEFTDYMKKKSGVDGCVK